jgi:hypothetical protein
VIRDPLPERHAVRDRWLLLGIVIYVTFRRTQG